MPTYEYRCPDGHEFENFVLKISQASAELPCPVCGKRGMRRMSAGGALLFKGSGFYITDYGKDGKKDQRDKAEKEKTAAAKPETAVQGAAEKGAAEKGSEKSEGATRREKSEAKGDSPAKSDAKKPPATAPAPKSGDKE